MLSTEHFSDKRKRINKLTKLDIHEGVVSKTRLEEISNNLRYKLDSIKGHPHSETIIKEANKFFAHLHVIESFSTDELDENYVPEHQPISLKKLNELIYINKLINFNYELLRLEALILFFQAQNEKEQMLKKLEMLRKDYESDLIDKTNHHVQHRHLLKLREEELKYLIARNEQYILQLEHYQVHLKQEIKKCETILRAQRKFYIDKILSYAADIEINGKKVFRDVPKAQMERFVVALVSLNEIKNRDIAKIEHKYQNLIDGLNGSTYKGGRSLLQGFNVAQNEARKAELLRARDLEIAQVETKFHNKIKQTATVCGVNDLKTDEGVKTFLEDNKVKTDLMGQKAVTNVAMKEDLINRDNLVRTRQELVTISNQKDEHQNELQNVQLRRSSEKENVSKAKESSSKIKRESTEVSTENRQITTLTEIVEEKIEDVHRDYITNIHNPDKKIETSEIFEHQHTDFTKNSPLANLIIDSNDISFGSLAFGTLDDLPDLSNLSLDDFDATSDLISSLQTSNHTNLIK